MMHYTVVLLLCLTVALDGQPLVETNLGYIQGYHKISYNGRTYSAFEGIPYAKPPVGKLRFEAPIDIEPWSETLDASKTYECSQVYPPIAISGTEDCLYLNVYVPRENPNPRDNLDVIVYIHGGAFMGGNPNMGGPRFFMDREVIFVNLNYRVGVFGLLSTEDDVVPGNNGLKDQSKAFKWIQDHIKQFGGNPKSVTITGASAGAASIHLHYFSKLSKGLFHRGVSSSGNALTPWAIQTGALERAKALAVLVGCSDTTTRVLVDCLKEKSANEILGTIQYLNSPADGFPQPIFAPIVEKKSSSSFLEDYPYNLLINKDFNDVPWLSGACTEEGALALMLLYKDLDALDDKFDKWAHYYMDYNYTACESDREFIAKEIREKYFGTAKMGRETYKTVIKLFGERMFIHSFENSSRLQASIANSKVYSYYYGYKNSFANDHLEAIGIDLDLGVGHTEDSQLIYDVMNGGHHVNANLSRDDEIIKDMMIDMYFSFANSSIPKINGFAVQPVSNSKEFTYLSIKSPTEVQMNFTDEITPTKFLNSLPIVDLLKFPEESCNRNEE